MCARRFLIALFVLILLTVAGAFAIFQWGGEMLVKQATPKGRFTATAAGSGPDYGANSAWLTRPGVDWPDDPTQWQPAEAPLAEKPVRPAALFYVHPTTYFERDRWNAPLKPDGAYTDFRTRLFLQSQASAFNDASRIWAPRYRQAAYGAFLLKSSDAKAALDLAYGDVRAAFGEFLRQNPDGPIVVAGHSQGALHLSRLLEGLGPSLKDRLVAAYVVGWPISDSADLPAMGLRACAHPEETGCLLSWLTFAEPANPDLILDSWKGSRGPTGVRRVRRDILCVNPIAGVRGADSPAKDNPGTLVPAADMRSAQLVPAMVGARCMGGLLYLTGNVPPLGSFVLPGNNYHVYDYALFWGAIRRDVNRRLAAWLDR